jgi:hypothetical protein
MPKFPVYYLLPKVYKIDEWLKQTDGGTFARRSDKLRALDKAIREYGAKPGIDTLNAIVDTMYIWIDEKGSTWQDTIRNKRYHAVENLFKQVMGVRMVPTDKAGLHAIRIKREMNLVEGMPYAEKPQELSKAEKEAIKEINKHRIDVLKILFAGATFNLTFGSKAAMAGKVAQAAKQIDKELGIYDRVASTSSVRVTAAPSRPSVPSAPVTSRIASTASSTARTVSSGVSRGASAVSNFIATAIPQAIKDLILDLFGRVASVEQIIMFVGRDIIGQVVASVTPVLSTISSAADTIKSWGQVAIRAYRAYEIRDHAQGLIVGDATHAFDGLKRILDRELNTSLAEAAINTTALGAKIGGTLLDGGAVTGPAVGVMAALAKLAKVIYDLGRDYKECMAANEIMRHPEKLDFTIFNTCPVLGCYYLLNATTSDIINFVSSEIGSFGWMDTIERMVREHINPIREQARRIVLESRFDLTGVGSNAGHAESLKDKVKRKAANLAITIGPQLASA